MEGKQLKLLVFEQRYGEGVGRSEMLTSCFFTVTQIDNLSCIKIKLLISIKC